MKQILCLLILVAAENVAISQESHLFRYIQRSSVSLETRQTERYAKIEARPTTKQTEIVRIDELSLIKTRWTLEINLPDERNVSAQVKGIKSKRLTSFTWSGRGDNGETIVLTVSGENVNGIIHTKNGLFLLEPLGGGIQVLTWVDQSKFPPDDPSDRIGTRKESSIQNDPTFPSGKANKLTSLLIDPVIDLLVVYTSAAASSVQDIGNLIESAIDVTNDIHFNASVSAVVTLVHSAQVSYTESGSVETDTDRLQAPSDNYMDNVHDLRDQYGADVVVLLVDSGDYYGWAYAIHVGASGAFATVRTEPAVSNYTFAHEIGHLIGGRHDDDQATTPLAYAHGYAKKVGNTWKTVMAVWEGADRIPFWSNPNTNYDGSPTGTTDYNHVSRVWNERASTVADFKSPPPPPDPPTNLVVSNSGQSGQPPQLSWQDSPPQDFSHYNVYRKYDTEPAFYIIGTPTSTSYTDYGTSLGSTFFPAVS